VLGDNVRPVQHGFGRTPEFTVGIEEELLLVDSGTHALSHSSEEVLAKLGLDERSARHDLYEAQIELSSPVSRSAEEAAVAVGGLRRALLATGAVALGAGIHPTAGFGDVQLVQAERYLREGEYLQGLVRRTPDCALHVHVGMPDAETAIHVSNGLREWLPVLEALSANSPFWHGLDSGLASARRTLRRGFPRVDIPPAFKDFEDYEAIASRTIAAGKLKDYTFIWWEVRPHPRFGTVELRAMDSQSSLATVAGLASLVQGLAAHVAERGPGSYESHEAVAESSFRASRYGVKARLFHRGSFRPVSEIAAGALEAARPHLRALGSEAPLEEIERIVRDGNGADRQRAAHRDGGMPGVLDLLVGETAAP
jgi:glutamate---cysteine ligase / carboxylate-amine ligase